MTGQREREQRADAAITLAGRVLAAKAGPPTGSLPSIKMPDPKFLVDRLKAKQTAGILSRYKRSARVGVPMALVNEVGTASMMGVEGANVYAVVMYEEPISIADFGALGNLRDGIDRFSTVEFAAERGFFYLPLVLLTEFDPVLPLAHPPEGHRYGADVDLERDLRKAVNGEDEAIAFVSAPDLHALSAMSEDALRAMDAWLHVIFQREFAGRNATQAIGLTREDVVNAHAFVVQELERRALQHDTVDTLTAETVEWLAVNKGAFAPINPSGVNAHADDPATLEELLDAYAKPIALRMPVVYAVGSICNAGVSKNDIDLLIRGPLDAETLHTIMFRLGRALPPRLSQRAQFHTDATGPFTAHVPLYDLVLVPHDGRGVIEMADASSQAHGTASGAAKSDDPLLEYPAKPGPRDAVVQFHFRGASVHLDLRMAVTDEYLIGWTMAVQHAGTISDVNTIAQGRAIGRQFNMEGSSINKPLLMPDRVFAVPKLRQPVAWLHIGNMIAAPGKVGATAEEAGVFIELATPKAEWGMQQAFSHEYFLTGDPRFNGLLFMRQLVGGSIPDERAAQAAGMQDNPRAFWTAGFTRSALPGVLKRHAVAKGTMPPLGVSAMPVTLMQETPRELRFWEADTAKDARETRDALVAAKVFTESNVAVMDEQFVRVTQKRFFGPTTPLDSGNAAPVAKAQDVRSFKLLYQAFKGPTVVRSAPSREVWHLVVSDRNGNGAVDYQLQHDPLAGDRSVGAIAVPVDAAMLDYEGGDASPGTKVGGLLLNDTKATPSHVRVDDVGDAVVDEAEGGQMAHIEFRGARLRGAYTLVREEPGSALFVLSPVQPAEPLDVAKVEGHTHHIPGDGSTGVAGNTNGHTHSLPPAGDERTGPPVGSHGSHIHRLPDGRYTGLSADAALGDVALGARVQLAPTSKAHRTRGDGTQVWDPAARSLDDDKGGDRAALRPPALFSPMKAPGKKTNVFRSIEDAATNFLGKAGAELLASGVQVEPKYNGFRAVLERWNGRTGVEGGTLLMTDGRNDIGQNLPGLMQDAHALGGDFVLDGEMMAVDDAGNFLPRRELARFRGTSPADDANVRLMVFDALYLPGAGNITQRSQVERRKLLEAFFAERKPSKRFVLVPRKLAQSRDALLTALRWSSSQQGSEGGMMKQIDATYSLGGENDLWGKVKLIRTLNVVVLQRNTVSGSPGVFNFLGGIGPIKDADIQDWAEVAKLGDEHFVIIGTTGNRKLDAKVGDVIEVESLEFLLEDELPRRIRWFGPAAAVRVVDAPAATVEHVRELLRVGEVKKHAPDVTKSERVVRLLKSEAGTGSSGDSFDLAGERFVFGVVLVPEEVDAQGDIYDATEVQKACHSFMEFFGHKIKIMHRGVPVTGVKVLENYVTKAPETHCSECFPTGTWMLAVRVEDDKLWEAVKSGAFTGFSMGGTALKDRLR